MTRKAFFVGILLPFVCLCFFSLVASQTYADTVTYHFSGVLSDPFGSYGVGTPFTGVFTYEQIQPDQTPYFDRGDYSYTSISLNIGSDYVSDSGPGVINVYDNSFYPTDLFHLYPFSLSGTVGGQILAPGAGLQLVLQDVTGYVFSNASLPGSNHLLSDFTGGGATFIQLQSEPGPFPFDTQIARGWLTELSAVPQSVQVVIDIKPGIFQNSINPKSQGKIPVAILTTNGFDATTVKPDTVLFGKTMLEAAPVYSAIEDVDSDGDIDMILHFNTKETGIQCGDTSASLKGQTISGLPIQGSDFINTVECK